MGNFVSKSAVRDCFNDWKRETLSFDVVTNLNLVQRTHRHLSIKSISKPGLKTFLGTSNSFKDIIIDDKFDVDSSQKRFISSVKQCSMFIKFLMAPSAHNFDEFSSE